MGLPIRLVRQMNNCHGTPPGENSEKIAAAKADALRYLAYRPRTVREMARKLTDKGYDPVTVDLVLAFLKEHKFLDDAAFTVMWIRSRTGEKPCGRRRIYAELVQKGVDRELIEQYLADLSPEKEEEMAAALAARKCRRDSFDYQKLGGFLVRRGFTPGLVKKILTQFIGDNSD